MDNQHIDLSDIEKILGKPTKMFLFTDEEESYANLRQSIFNAPHDSYDKAKLPFDGVQLMKYELHVLKQYSEQKKEEGKLLFYIKSREKGKTVFASGYYDEQRNLFVLLAHSIVNRTIYSDQLQELHSDIAKQHALYEKSTLKQDLSCKTASIAASYALGKKVDFTEWKSLSGKSLAESYEYFRLPNIRDLEAKKANTHKKGEQHIFKLENPHICKACGYYDEETNHFYIMKGSMFSKAVSEKYAASTSWDTRKHLVEKSCTDMGKYYLVDNDFKCRTATAAASILMGKISYYASWVDNEGNHLNDIYPDHFTVRISHRSISDDNLSNTEDKLSNPHFFLINDVGDRKYEAEAYYDPNSKTLTVLAGAHLSEEVSKEFRFTALEFGRRNFIKKYCSQRGEETRLKENYAFDSPQTAACYIMGRTADGWHEWQSKNGKLLIEIYQDYV
ncbi:DUF4357 domain-containing protein [Bacteroides sp. UBA939]|uniref:DUF4357 domain-containing protein n=1 Tax=Bacteroides sp. UBA939 TaxID=1946092 RepID=UPI0025C4E3F0|nr:DUF4357 domain-containing protein [Bacteroides sp. UBA939]